MATVANLSMYVIIVYSFASAGCNTDDGQVMRTAFKTVSTDVVSGVTGK